MFEEEFARQPAERAADHELNNECDRGRGGRGESKGFLTDSLGSTHSNTAIRSVSTPVESVT